jgi:hypothetical protein
LTAFAMLAAYLILGGSAIVTGSAPALGTLSVAYGASGIVSYLGFTLAPIMRLFNINAVSAVAAGIGATTMMTGQINMTLIMLTCLHILDFRHATSIAEGNQD